MVILFYDEQKCISDAEIPGVISHFFCPRVHGGRTKESYRANAA